MIEYKSIKDHVYDYLSAKIIQGSLKPNSKIDEKAICDHLGVSRTPVRESLIELTNEGYLERMPRRGYKVREITREEVKEIFEIIGSLESLATSSALSNLKKEDIDSLDGLVKKMEDSLNKRRLHDYYRLQKQFHNTIIQASGNKKLYETLTFLKKRFIKEGYDVFEDENALYRAMKRFNEEHKEILNLIRQKKVKALEKYLKEIHWNFQRYRDIPMKM